MLWCSLQAGAAGRNAAEAADRIAAVIFSSPHLTAIAMAQQAGRLAAAGGRQPTKAAGRNAPDT